MVSRELGVPASDDLTNHVAYLKSWLQAMKNDSRFIIMAIGTSQQSRLIYPLVQQKRGRSGGRRGRTRLCLTSCGNGFPPTDTDDGDVLIGATGQGHLSSIERRLGFSD